MYPYERMYQHEEIKHQYQEDYQENDI